MATGMETTGGQEGSLSTWAGPYVTDMLGKAQAFSELPYQPYTGQLTSGPSALQTQAFQGIGGLTVPTALTTAGQQAQQTFGTSQQYMPTVGTVQSYMNPYLEAVLEPQRREANRQAEIARNQMQGRMAQAGAYGGSRQAIMEAEAQRNLQTLLSDVTGKGYAGAFEAAQKQRQADIDAGLRGLAAQTAATQALTQAGSQEGEYGLRGLQQQLSAGAAQRDIEQAGLTADYNQYLREIQYPREQLEFQRNMLAGLPIAAASFYQPAPSAFQSAAGGAGTTLELLKILGQIGRQS
jgi:hypothetical protein